MKARITPSSGDGDGEALTVKITIARPGTDIATAAVLRKLLASLPQGRGKVKISIEGLTPNLASALLAAVAVANAQLNVRKKRRNG